MGTMRGLSGAVVGGVLGALVLGWIARTRRARQGPCAAVCYNPPTALAAATALVLMLLFLSSDSTTNQSGPLPTLVTNPIRHYNGISLTENTSAAVTEFLNKAQKNGAEPQAQETRIERFFTSESTFVPVNVSKLDRLYRKAREARAKEGPGCMWFPTSHCTPYGVVNFGGVVGCGSVVSAGSGFCECPDGTVVGKVCRGGEWIGTRCSAVCGGLGVLPGHRELLLRFPPQPEAARPKAVIVTLTSTATARNCRQTLVHFEAAFNSRFGYPYLALFPPNDPPPAALVKYLRATTTSPITVYVVPDAAWARSQKATFLVSAFFDLKVLSEYDWYWRLDDDIILLCEVLFDPFVLMAMEGKVHGFGAMVKGRREGATEAVQRIAGLAAQGHRVEPWGPQSTGCTFWPGYEIGSLSWYRSSSYSEAFTSLSTDKVQIWDPVQARTLVLATLLPANALYYFESIPFSSPSRSHIPIDTTTCRSHPIPASDSDFSQCDALFVPYAALSQSNSTWDLN